MSLYRGSFQAVGGTFLDPDYVYYNASIINNSTTVSDETGSYTVRDPAVRFNETRDKEILQNAGEYYFSIVRVQMNGTGRDLPLFIPAIQSGGGSADVNLTVYGLALSYSQSFSTYDVATATATTRTVTVCPDLTYVQYEPETKNRALAPVPSSVSLQNGNPQDISTRYYWVYSYQWWLDLVNKTILNPDDLPYGNGYPFSCAWGKTYQALLNAEPLAGIVFPTLQVFNDYVNAPQLVYNAHNNRFSLYGDSDGFGSRIQLFTPNAVATAGAPITFQSAPSARLFFDANTFGLFANLPNKYWNDVSPTNNPFLATPLTQDASPGAPAVYVPTGLVNEMLFTNKFYTNVSDYRIPPEAGRAPLGYVPIGAQKPYWVMEQESPSNDSLWSPIETLIITSTLMGVAPEYTSPPNALGTSNNVFSSPTVPSAFDPIISDIMVDSSQLGSGVNRQYILWEPKAEYRLADFTTKGTAVRNIDIQIFWRCRLNGQLYPLQMFNLSSVSIKAMFKHRSLNGGKGAW
jgi:hypothetical protein